MTAEKRAGLAGIMSYKRILSQMLFNFCGGNSFGFNGLLAPNGSTGLTIFSKVNKKPLISSAEKKMILKSQV